MSCCSTVFFGTKGMALARRLALRRSGFAWRFKDGSAPTARLSCLILLLAATMIQKSSLGENRAVSKALMADTQED
jgi:hypothetical protein